MAAEIAIVPALIETPPVKRIGGAAELRMPVPVSAKPELPARFDEIVVAVLAAIVLPDASVSVPPVRV